MKINHYNISIKELAINKRPREKLINQGSKNLKNSELLAIILNTGSKKEEIMSLSSRLIKDYGEKALIKEKNPNKLASSFNVSINKACQLIACFELGQRFFKENKNDIKIFRSSANVFKYLSSMSDLKKEQLRGLYLNSQFQLIHDEIISIGTLNTNLVHPREIFKSAIYYNASAIIIAHNHPSGKLKASQNDLKITKKLIKISKLLEIELLDHLIIANNNYLSLIK
jgi:DNA repair protein RadC